MSLSEVAIKRPVFTTMVTLGILALGLIAASRLGTDLYPDVTLPVVTVTVPYPGAGPGDVERQILKPIEDAVISINRADRVNAFARDNVGVVVITFKMDANLEVVADDLDTMTAQGLLLGSWGANVVVKIPITTTAGESCVPVVRARN